MPDNVPAPETSPETDDTDDTDGEPVSTDNEQA